MTNTQKIIAGVLVVCALLGASAWFGVTPFRQAVQQASQQLGSVVDSNVPWFTNGYKAGTVNALYTNASITLQNGQDQGVWQNNTGQPVVIDTSHLVTNATLTSSVASSTFVFSVGATSTKTIAEPQSTTWITSTLTPLSIDKYSLATSTSVTSPGSILNAILADNYVNHTTGKSALIEVPTGWYVFVKIDSLCAYAQAGIACELATSTNRGFTTVTVPFWYHYSSPN